eukprot:m.118834 g.118834  ORF g.118834 m.118834 type:complete len:296 (+) comp28702_c0_seq1:124-1011(+)
MDLSFDSTVAVYARWLTKKPLWEIFSQHPDCVRPCYDPTRTLMMGFIGQFVWLVCIQAFSSKMFFYKSFKLGEKFMFCMAMVAMIASINSLARATRALLVQKEFQVQNSNSSMYTVRLQDFEASLGYQLGFHVYEVVIWIVCLVCRLPVDLTNIHLKALIMFSAVSSLVYGSGELMTCCLMSLDLASPILKIKWIVSVFDLDAHSTMVTDFVDMILAPVLALRLLLLGWLLATAFRTRAHFDGLDDDAFTMVKIGVSFAVVTGVSWIFDLRKVLGRLGETKSKTTGKSQTDKKNE